MELAATLAALPTTAQSPDNATERNGWMNLLQKILRPVLNWVVETVFPTGAFFGNDYLRNLKTDSAGLSDKWGSTEMACAMFVTSYVREMGAESATFEASDITASGVEVGSWRLTVEKIDD